MSGDLERIWNSDKDLSIEPVWQRRTQGEYVRLVSPVEIGGITEQGLLFTASAHVYRPDGYVTFQLEYASVHSRRGHPFVRFEWKPKSPHNNKGIGPPEYQHMIIKGTHVHPFDLNWEHSEDKVRKGESANRHTRDTISCNISRSPCLCAELL